MKGYVLGEIEITDPATFADYGKQVPATIAKYGGKYLVRGGKAEVVEGAACKRMVVLEFPTLEQARKWYTSPDYAPLITLRQKGSRGRLILVEGME